MLKILCSVLTARYFSVGNMFCRRLTSKRFCSSSFLVYKNPLQNVTNSRLSCKKYFSSSSRNYALYEADGQTFGIVINKKNSDVFLVNSWGIEGFLLSNGVQLVGSAIVFPHTVLSWNVLCAKDVNEEALVLFKLLQPKVDILVFGYGSWKDYTPEVKETFTKCCKKFGIRYEALPTEHAVGTYNFLAEDRVLVAGAFIPPVYVDRLRFDRSGISNELDLLEDMEEEVQIIPAHSPTKKLIK